MVENPFTKFPGSMEEKQEEIEVKRSGMAKRGRPRKRKEAVTLNLLLAKADKQLLMKMAESESLGMNDLVTMWIRKEYKAWEKKHPLENR